MVIVEVVIVLEISVLNVSRIVIVLPFKSEMYLFKHLWTLLKSHYCLQQ